MDWTITVAVFFSVLQGSLGFNIEPTAWKSFSNPAAGFGHKVIQKRNGLLVSAPLEQYSQQGRGQLYDCSPSRPECNKIDLSLPPYAVNTSLGLAMAFNPSNERSMVCGPTIPKDCKSITMYNGLCLEIDGNNRVRRTTPTSDTECPSRPADIAFLLDGSGSVASGDFTIMKQFVVNVISSFLGKDSRFAIIQFSSDTTISYHFNNFQTTGSWQSQINNIRQVSGGTQTAKAIHQVANEVFITSNGNRENVNNILIVITDGESQDQRKLPSAVEAANRKNIIRFAIGVGDAFKKNSALKELQIIASSSDQVFKVVGFDALDQIRKTLQEKIFSIEGSQTGGETLKMEMSQLGFGAAFFSQGFQMTAVGANEWKGGLLKYTANGVRSSFYQPNDIDNDSYLGYSIAIANTKAGTYTAVGAPRYQHRGIVMYVLSVYSQRRIDPFGWQSQSGEYFGAEVCTMDANHDGFTDALLISAPMHSERDREGRVYVCDVSDENVDCHFNDPLVLRGALERGRFGSSLAVLPDLNADDVADLAVGAPLENGGQGSVYIFHGSGFGRVNPTYSQRITASEVQSGLTYFGMSISPRSLDQSGDTLPDLMIGSKGTVVLLRSKPIVQIEAVISFTPQQILPPQTDDCSKPLEAAAKLCFPMSKVTALDQAQARINYTFTLDTTRLPPTNRAFIREKEQDTTGSLNIELGSENCVTINFFIQKCLEDAYNPLDNELSYSFDGLPLSGKLRPSLSQQSATTVRKDLGFAINCGDDDTCTDSLIVDFNFTKTSVVQVGIDDLLNVTVSMENTEEDSYNTKVILTYPPGLSYRKFTGLQKRIDCTSLDSEDGLTRGQTECFINRPIFKSKAKALFVVSYGFDTKGQLDRRIFITANATSGNAQSPSSQRYKLREIDVKYSISVTIGSSHSYTNFTSGQNDLQKPFNQSIKVTNEIRAVNISVVIRVPVKLGNEDIWVDSDNLTIADCQKEKDEKPTMTDFVPQIQENKFVNCSVAKCRVFRCTRFMTQMERKDYFITGNLSSGWIQQIGLESAKFLLITTVTLEYDTDRFIFYTTETNNNPPIRKIEAEVEVYTEVNFTKEIIGGSLGALALVLLLTAGLYKAGFFKSKYQQMIADDAQGPEALEGAPEDPPA